ncbi:hypothetical protein NM688_g6594 [Phlebia brevispora]|uniref:Uncharacterized protein n=1 Tax=Phlebia brevispora TaxID=194682 RepID=A0ACC1SE84_9APHY|nr:hypothetical protein NM688_g6594 [Phlebia brevispora]
MPDTDYAAPTDLAMSTVADESPTQTPGSATLSACPSQQCTESDTGVYHSDACDFVVKYSQYTPKPHLRLCSASLNVASRSSRSSWTATQPMTRTKDEGDNIDVLRASSDPNAEGVCFAHQLVNDACALQVNVSIALSLEDSDVAEELEKCNCEVKMSFQSLYVRYSTPWLNQQAAVHPAARPTLTSFKNCSEGMKLNASQTDVWDTDQDSYPRIGYVFMRDKSRLLNGLHASSLFDVDEISVRGVGHLIDGRSSPDVSVAGQAEGFRIISSTFIILSSTPCRIFRRTFASRKLENNLAALDFPIRWLVDVSQAYVHRAGLTWAAMEDEAHLMRNDESLAQAFATAVHSEEPLESILAREKSMIRDGNKRANGSRNIIPRKLE